MLSAANNSDLNGVSVQEESEIFFMLDDAN